MDVMRRTFVLLLLLAVAGPAAGQTVYRCRSGDTWAFQDRPCSSGQTAAGTHTIRAKPGSGTPPAVQALLDQAHTNAERERLAALTGPAPEPPAPLAPRKAYRCTVGRGFNERHYYRATPCPELLETGLMYVTRDNGNYGTYTDVYPIIEKTTEKVISERQACEEKRARVDPYTRYQTSNPCR